MLQNAGHNARNLASGCAHCAHNPVFVTMHCLGSLFGLLFTSTIHRVKKKYKNFKNFLEYGLIYKIFTLHLL